MNKLFENKSKGKPSEKGSASEVGAARVPRKETFTRTESRTELPRNHGKGS